MKPALLWAPRAEEDVLEIYLTIAFDNLRAADRWLLNIEKRVGGLVASPALVCAARKLP